MKQEALCSWRVLFPPTSAGGMPTTVRGHVGMPRSEWAWPGKGHGHATLPLAACPSL